MDRRDYLKGSGAALAGLTLAGCLDSSGGGGGEGDGDTEGEDGDNEENETGTDGGSEQQSIIAGTASGFPPFELKKDGELQGFDIDLLEAVVEASEGYTLEKWSDLDSFDSLIPSLTTNKIDVIAAAMTITDKRDNTIDFSDPYYSANQSVLVKAGSDFQPGSLEDLPGNVVGSQKGTTGEGVIKGLIEDGTMKESNYKAYDTYVLAVTDLENGNVDAVILDEPVAASFAGERDVEVSFTHETGEQYGFGVRTDDDDLQEALNGGLQTVKDDGTYEELTKKWFQ
ncbi:transporter substrate-binding domain-containing protein [Haloarchaeobius sp. DFWS5]|uniref:transporter substrate-binding domain-containing protein n=1 Tax=Haloarchaeobius sp. DFWS5 TaxID=3446114 RepID=UPI003EBE9575